MATAGSTQAERTARVLAPEFVDGLDVLATDEVRERRDLARDEREFQSYLRRLVQARIDVLKAERGRRTSGGEAAPLLDRITQALASGPQGRSRGEVVRVQLPEDDMEEAERRISSVLGEADLVGLEALDDAAVDRMLADLLELEREVSSSRAEVLRVVDDLQEELKGRYRADPSQIPQGI